MKNLNLLFNKSYFTGLGQMDQERFGEELKKRNQEIYNTVFIAKPYPQGDYRPVPKELAPQRFRMKTTYPGLLTGTGYMHEAEQGSNYCIKLGFSFDYVTGQPYIPGSSVKGLLRSCFEKPEIREVLSEVLGVKDPDALAGEQALGPKGSMTKAIFDGTDIFFDAVIASGDRKGHVVGSDYITPHGNDETKTPIPLLMLKVMPNVTFEFRFCLQDSTVGNWTFTAEQKKKVFRTLLEIYGAGAKTNVGYGTLIPV